MKANTTTNLLLGAIDLRNGRVWGATLTPLPYPSDPVYNKPQTSQPSLVGRFRA